MLALMISPMAAAGAFVAGVTTSGFRMLGSLHGDRIDLDLNEVAICFWPPAFSVAGWRSIRLAG